MTREAQAITWRWAALGLLAVVGSLVAWAWATTTTASADTDRAVRGHGERIAGIESWEHTVDSRLERIERKIDELRR